MFCGPGRSLIRGTTQYIDGSPIAAFKKGSAKPFTSINISDGNPELMQAAETRLKALGAPVHATSGPASAALPQIVKRLPQSGLHLAFLDPHNLGTLSFDLFEQLAKLKNVDIILHVSLYDLQRNADRYTSEAHDEFDRFAPGWRDHVGTDMNQETLRGAIIKFWSDKVMELGLPRAQHCQMFTGERG